MLVKRVFYMIKKVPKHPVYNYKRYWVTSYWLFGIIPIYFSQDEVEYTYRKSGV